MNTFITLAIAIALSGQPETLLPTAFGSPEGMSTTSALTSPRVQRQLNEAFGAAAPQRAEATTPTPELMRVEAPTIASAPALPALRTPEVPGQASRALEQAVSYSRPKAPAIDTTERRGAAAHASLIAHTLRKREGRFLRCYANRLRTHPGLTGRMTLDFVVERSGLVDTATVGGDTTGDATLQACMIRTVRGLRFAPRTERTAYAYPLYLSAMR